MTEKRETNLDRRDFVVALGGVAASVNAEHRAHDVKNLFIVDGSSLVTSGRGQPTMTIQALAFRAAEKAGAAAKRGEL